MTWRSEVVGGVNIPIHSLWTRSGETSFGNGEALVTLSERLDGDLVDRARRFVTPQGGAPDESGICLHGGASTLRAVYQDGSARVLYYIVSHGFRGTWQEVTYPETHVVYVLSGRWMEAVKDIDARFIESDADFDVALDTHPSTPEGHLAFGPVLVPGDWSVVNDDASLTVLPPAPSPYREIDVGGGYLRLAGDHRDEIGREALEFRPVPLKNTDEADVRLYLGGPRGDVTLKGAPAATDVKACHTRFVAGKVVRYAGRHGRWERLGYLWRDALGYSWELSYLLADARMRNTVETGTEVG